MKKRRVKNTVRHDRGKPPKERFAGKRDEDASDFGGSDVDSDDFYHDEIDDFHADQEKVLLGDDRNFDANLSTREEEEILPITDDEDEDDDLDEEEAEDELEGEDDQDTFHKSDMESDLDDKSEDDGLPSLSAWGKKKSTYYGADFVDKDRGKSYRPEDEEKAVAEEEAGIEVYKNLNASIKCQSLGLDEFEDDEKVAELEVVDKDLTNLSKEDHKQHLKKESPEFFWLVDDFKTLMKELTERISPLSELVEEGRINGKGAEYIRIKHSLILHYCMNICFYMMLKSSNTPAKYHPVIKRLSQYRKFLNQFEDTDKKLKSEIDYMLEKVKNGESIEFYSDVQLENEEESLPVDRDAALKQPTLKRLIEEDMSEVSKKSKKQRVEKVSAQFETEVEREVSSLYVDMKKNQRDAKLLLSPDDDDDELQDEEYDLNESKDLEESDNDDGDEDGKRTITYEIAKNKGLLPYRKKEYRNPRVRNRMKFRRAKIRRKGQVREPRKELTRYGGELTGIRTNVARSIKIK